MHKPTPGEIEGKQQELHEALPVPAGPAEQAPVVEQAASVAKQEAGKPADPLIPPRHLPQPKGRETKTGAREAAHHAAGLAHKAFSMTASLQAPPAPEPVTPPEPVSPVDAGGQPLRADPGTDAQVSSMAQRIQHLREGGHRLRSHATRHRSLSHSMQAKIQEGQSGIAQAESGIATIQDHTAHRREVLGQANSALEVSKQKADTVAGQAPEFAAKGDEGTQKSGPMASEASGLAADNASKRPDDADAAEKSQEQGQKLTKAGADLGTMDSAISQTKTKAEGLGEEAAQAKAKNSETATKIGATEASLAQADGKAAEMTGQNATAKAQLAALSSGPEEVLGRAQAIDEQGEAAITASVALEQRLRASEAAFAAGMQNIPPRTFRGSEGPNLQRQAYGDRTSVNLGEGAPSWLTGEDPPRAEERKAAEAKERERRQAEIRQINEQAGGNFQNLSAGDKAGIALNLTGRHLMQSLGATSFPNFVGGILRGFIDPRVSLMGVVQGLSMVASGVANLFSAKQWAKDPLGNLLKSSADIATGITIVLGSIAGLAMAIVVILTAATILTLGALGPLAAVVIPFCMTVAGTVGPWAITAAEIALVLQGLVFIKNLIDAATAETAEQLQSKSDEMTQDASTAGQMAMQIGMHELMGGGEEGGVPGVGEEVPPAAAEPPAPAAAEAPAPAAAEAPAPAPAAAEPPAPAPAAAEPPAPAPAAAEPPAPAPAAAEPPAPAAAEPPAPNAEGPTPAPAAAEPPAPAPSAEAPALDTAPESPAPKEGTSTPAGSLPEEAKMSDGAPVAAEATSPDGETKVKVPETGNCEICQSPCEEARTKYPEALENPDLENRLTEAEAIQDPNARADAIAELVPELESAQKGAEIRAEFEEAGQLGESGATGPFESEPEPISGDEPGRLPELDPSEPRETRAEKFQRGNDFNTAQSGIYGADEVRLENGKIVDGYTHGEEIISRKNTQLSEIPAAYSEEYVNEFLDKYGEGNLVADTPANRLKCPDLIGKPLQGQLILEVPIQQNPVPQDLATWARRWNVIIRDPVGTVYN